MISLKFKGGRNLFDIFRKWLSLNLLNEQKYFFEWLLVYNSIKDPLTLNSYICIHYYTTIECKYIYLYKIVVLINIIIVKVNILYYTIRLALDFNICGQEAWLDWLTGKESWELLVIQDILSVDHSQPLSHTTTILLGYAFKVSYSGQDTQTYRNGNLVGLRLQNVELNWSWPIVIETSSPLL